MLRPSRLPWLGTLLALLGWVFLFAALYRAFDDRMDMSVEERLRIISGIDGELRAYEGLTLLMSLCALVVAVRTWRRANTQAVVTIGTVVVLGVVLAALTIS